MKTNSIINDACLKKHVLTVIQSLGQVKITREYYNFKCPVCGDSKKNKFKKRAYILFRKHPICFVCHNCNFTTSAEKWLKTYYPQQYSQYVKEILENSNQDNTALETELLKKQAEDFKKSEIERKTLEVKSVQFFKPILKGSGDLFTKAIDFCESRGIPRFTYIKWFVATDGMYKGRLIIPFYDDEGKIYYWQARTLIGQEPKYTNRLTSRDNAIFGYYQVNSELEVCVFEGVIDSLMTENAIACCGTKWPESVQNKLDKLKCFYIFDSDVSGVEAAKKMLLLGKSVFMWKPFIKEFNLPEQNKWDFNDAFLYLKRTSKFTFKELEKYFTNNSLDRIHL